MDTSALDEAYERLHRTGPEFEGWLSNHGPMVAEALLRRQHGADIGRWVDAYAQGLEEFPPPSEPVGDDWREALGDPKRISGWTEHFHRALGEASWPDVLNCWWPRLLPGVAAAATHGVIRVGHAVRALQSDGENGPHVTELAQALGYWASRWQPVPGMQAAEAVGTPDSPMGAMEDSIDRVPRIEDQSGGVRERLDRLGELRQWHEAMRRPVVPATPDAVPAWLEQLVDTAVGRYLQYGHGNGVMLVHSATAPNAVLRCLDSLDREQWVSSARAAWGAVTALTAVYAPRQPADPAVLPRVEVGATAADIFARAVAHGDEHVIKFADTAIDSYARQGNDACLAAVLRSIALIEPW